jgi:hypothetical protein
LQIISGEIEQDSSPENKQEVTQSQPIQILQGDSLLPLLFCISFIPLKQELNRADCGYQVQGTERKINHLLYTNDLKRLSRSEEDLENEISILKRISTDINTNLAFEKCTKICPKKGGSRGNHT